MHGDQGATASVPSRSGRLQLSLEIARADRTEDPFAFRPTTQTYGMGIQIHRYAEGYRGFYSNAGGSVLASMELPYNSALPDLTGWSHVALVRSLAANGSGELRAYLDGVQVAIPHMNLSREGLCSGGHGHAFT